ncbi:YqaJ viral recombinase family protein [Canibacter zhoujuaniae]|uniref:YqaJ viral recombinase family protein n=1 Tax=Canibacter zhoujuaniae TaxID=2708343 RepID=UPI001422E1CE|nr:YqaJ viral recombinase family protein [Canibacter zhoujuaniae]
MSFLERLVTDGSNHAEWLQARYAGITASDVAKLASRTSIESTARNKLLKGVSGGGFGNAYTQHGIEREPVIAAWVETNFGIHPSQALYHAPNNRRHLATPDGIREHNGIIELSEIKTTNKPFKGVPRNYLRQIYWQQHVLEAERTLFVWEQHSNFIPVSDHPQWMWVERNERAIKDLVQLADELIERLHELADEQRR